MRRLLAFLLTVTFLALAFTGAAPVAAEEPDPTPSEEPERDAKRSDGHNTTAEEKARQRYHEAWERYNETRAEMQRAWTAYNETSRECDSGNQSACDRMKQAGDDLDDAREENQRARHDHEQARWRYERMSHGGPGPDDHPPRRGPDNNTTRHHPRDRPGPAHTEAYERWREAREKAEVRHREVLDRVPAHARERFGFCGAEGDEVACRHVRFTIDATNSSLDDLSVGRFAVFKTLVFPGAPDPDESRGAPNLVRIEGDDWRFVLSDAPPAPMRFKADNATFALTLADGVTTEAIEEGFRLHLSAGDMNGTARITGAVAIDPADPQSLLVTGDARFIMHAQDVVLPGLQGTERAAVERALERGRIGAEMKIVKAQDGERGRSSVVGQTTLYDDMNITLEDGPAVDETPAEGKRAYTITVDAHADSGRTIAVTLDEGILDPKTIAFRYFDVDDGGNATPAAIIKAASLEDVLDPDDDGTVAEWWLVQDESGVKLLVSIPSFSVHKIELASLDVLIQQPSLVIGFLAAVAITGLGMAALFRRPKDD
ncbi:MAG: hypothetical protein KY455_13260 [Euryarchaeota archaeon]|nr:hypothetical protein [Euryarchaeota archaeon]